VARRAAARPRQRSGGPTLALLAAATLAAAAPAVALSAAVWLLPGIFVWIAERTPGRPLARCLLLAGLAGALPALVRLWSQPADLAGAASDAITLRACALPWAAQAAGWLCAQLIPVLTGAAERAATRSRLRALESARRRLMTEWSFEQEP
jgi:hypothetical protein